MSQWAKKGEGGGNGGGQRGGRGGGGNRGGNRGGGKGGGGGGNNNTSPPPSSSPPPATAVSASSSSIAAIASSAAAAAAAPAPVSTLVSIPPSSSGKDELSSSKSESGESTSSSEAEKTYLIRKGDLAAPLSKAGSLGSKLSIKANFFPITLRIKQLFVFSVIFDPPIPQELGAKRRKELGQFYPILDAAFGRQNSFNGQTINSMKEVDVNALTALIPADENKPYGVFPVGTVSKTGFRVRKNDSTGSQVSSATISYERTVTADDMNSSEISHVTATFVRSLLTRQLKLLLMNNAYFDPKQMHKVGNYQFQLMMGYQSVVNACHNRQALIVDVVHKIYQPETVYKIVAEKMDKLKAGASSNPAVALALFRESRWEESVEEFRGRRMIYRNGRQTRVVRCDFIDFEINLDAPMDPESKDKNNTFRAYFKSKYNVDLKQRFTGMVCEFRMRPSKAWRLIEQGIHVDGTYYPLELCNSTGSLDRDRGDFRMLKAIADISRKPPQEKLNLINKFASLLSTLNSASSSASASASSAAAPSSAGKNGKKSIADMAQENLFIEAKMMEAQARLLPGPRIVSGSNIFFVNGDDPKKNSQVQQGVMKQTLLGTNGKPYSLPSTKPFGVIFSQEEERDEICKYFLEEFGKEVARMKIRLPASKSFPVPAGGPNAWQTKAIEIATREAANLSFVVVILPQRNTDLIYSMIKTIFIQHGVIHSCIKADSINRTYEGRLKGAIPSYAFQLFVKQGALQWCVESGPSCEKHITLPAAIQNARFGGNVTTMIVAADVSHDAKAKTTWNPPAASSSSSSSSTVSSSFASRQKVDTVGFVATYDANFTQFHSFVGTQTSGRLGSDLIQKSDEYMKGACERFKQKNNKYPEHIIVYRDGVGESQIASFVYEEMKKYQSAFDALKIKPKLTVIVVQKRVGARFFTAHGTAPPGTVIDSGITSSARREFYLVNCETPPNANAVPTRYIIVKDDNEFTMDQIELFTHHLSYNFSNWRGPIKIPAPVKCADRLSRLFGRFIRHANVNPTIASTVYFL